MSIILAIKENNNVHVMADTCCTIGNEIKYPIYNKLFTDKNNQYIIGGVGCGRFIQSLLYKKFPVYDAAFFIPHEFMVEVFVPFIQKIFESLKDESPVHENEDTGFSLLVAFQSYCFTIFSDYTVIENMKYMCLGSPQEAGLVSLSLITEVSKDLTPYDQMTTIMGAVFEHCHFVSPPLIYFNTLTLSESHDTIL